MSSLRTLIAVGGLTVALLAAPQNGHSDVAGTVAHAQALLRQGDAAGAAVLLRQELEHDPGDAALLDLAGVADAQLGRTAEAERDLLAAIHAAPQLDGAYLNLGRLYQQEAEKNPSAAAKALAIYARLLRLQPANPEAHYQSAVLLLRAGKDESALRHLQQLPAGAQEHSQVAAVVCSAEAGLQDKKTVACVEHWLALSDFAVQDAEATLPYIAGAGESVAERRVLQAMAAHGSISPAQQQRLATLDQQQGDDKDARALLEPLVVANPQPFPLLLQLAEIADHENDFKGALGYLAHARALEPENAAVHFFFGMECVRLQLMQEAYLSLQKAVALAPGNPYYNYALGAVILQRRNPDAAVQYFRKYHQLRPQDVHGTFALGAACFAAQDYAQARRLLQPLTSVPATAAGAWYMLGRIDISGDHLALAEAELRHALQANPHLADAAAHLGLLLLRQHRDAEAAQSLQQALHLDSGNYVANFQLLLLYRKTHDARAGQQAQRWQALQKKRISQEQEFYRTIRIDPMDAQGSQGQGSDERTSH